MAAAALTITSLREQFIDFSEPFLNLGISILYKVIIFIQFFLIFVFYHIIIKNKRPEKKKNQLFSFLSPFEVTVWICVIVAYFGNFVNTILDSHINFLRTFKNVLKKISFLNVPTNVQIFHIRSFIFIIVHLPSTMSIDIH